MITFLLSGLWHGASWTYVIWGFIHGVYLIASHALHTIRQKIFPQFHSSASALVLFFKRLGVFSFVLAALVFFRADTISDAFSIIRNSLSAAGRLGAGLAASTARMNPHPITEVFQQWLKPIAYDRPHFGLFCGLIAVLFAAEIIDYRENLITAIGRQRAWIRFALYFMAVMSIMNLGVTHEAPFIYFQF